MMFNRTYPVVGKRSKNEDFRVFYKDKNGVYLSNTVEWVFLYGAGVIGGEFVSSSEELSKTINSKKYFDIDWLEVAGSVVFLYEDNEKIEVRPDPIGAGMVYVYQKNGIVGVSPDIRSLVLWLKTIGIVVEKSIFYQAMLACVTDGYFGYSSYDDIKVLESGKYLIFQKEKIEESYYGVEDFLKSDVPYYLALKNAANSISLNVRAVSNNRKKTKITHLTGGLDSRLVLSALDRNNLINSWLIYCSGNQGHPDFDTASNIASIFSARMTNYSGLILQDSPSSLSELYAWQADACNGMIPNMPIHTGMSVNNDALVLSGGYGECYRGYWPDAASVPKDQVASIIWGLHNDAAHQNEQIVNPFVQNLILEKLSEFLHEKMDAGWSQYDSLQLLYLQHKNRYFVGNITSNFSKYTKRFDPLYSLQGFLAAYRAGSDYRTKKGVMFDLMNNFSPALSTLPFGTTSWPEELIVNNNIKLINWPTKILKPVFVEFDIRSNKSMFQYNNARASFGNPPAGIPPWQWNTYEQAQIECLNILDGKKDFFEFFNKKIVFRILKNKLKSRVHIRQVFSLLYSLKWLYGLTK